MDFQTIFFQIEAINKILLNQNVRIPDECEVGSAVQVDGTTHWIKITLDEDRRYIVTVPSLPGCITHGETYDEARESAVDAIECYLESKDNE